VCAKSKSRKKTFSRFGVSIGEKIRIAYVILISEPMSTFDFSEDIGERERENVKDGILLIWDGLEVRKRLEQCPDTPSLLVALKRKNTLCGDLRPTLLFQLLPRTAPACGLRNTSASFSTSYRPILSIVFVWIQCGYIYRVYILGLLASITLWPPSWLPPHTSTAFRYSLSRPTCPTPNPPPDNPSDGIQPTQSTMSTLPTSPPADQP
jgi:hypothetical protein